MQSQDARIGSFDSSRIDTKLFKTITISLYLKEDSEKSDSHFVSIIKRSSTMMGPVITLEPMDEPLIGCKTLAEVEKIINNEIHENPITIFAFNVLYDSNDPKKEEHVKKALELINKTTNNENVGQLALLKRKISSSENNNELSEELQNKFQIKKEVVDASFAAGSEIKDIVDIFHHSLLKQHSLQAIETPKNLTNVPKNDIPKEQINQADSQTIKLPLISTMTIGLFSKNEDSHSLYVTQCKESDRIKTTRGVTRTEKDLSTDKIKQNLFNLIDANSDTTITIALIYDANDREKEAHVKTSIQLLKGLDIEKFKFALIKCYSSSKRETVSELSQELLDQFPVKYFIEGEMQISNKLIEHDEAAHDSLFKPRVAKQTFLDAVQSLENKEAELRKRKCGFAADAAQRACKVFREAFKNFNSDGNYKNFATVCNEVIEQEEPELKAHRGYGRLLANIGLAIAGIGIFYVVALGIHRLIHGPGHHLFFYHNKTDSEKRLEVIKECIPSMSPTA